MTPSDAVIAMCDKIKAAHPGRILGFLYYGSSLRAINNPDKMLDFYVLVDSYRKTHKNPLRAFLNWLIPPAVYYMEYRHKDTELLSCKYSLISLNSFEKKCGSGAFLSVIWGRFSQPCVLLFAKDNFTHHRIQTARAMAIRHIARQTRPLLESPYPAISFWARAYYESYRTELRPESPEIRTREIVERYTDRYEKLTDILFAKSETQGHHTPAKITALSRLWCRWNWFWRRIIGKIMAAIRVLNSAFTFSGGLDYALHKLESHSGVRIEVTDSQRRHPVLWSPVLAWKLWRKGAFR